MTALKVVDAEGDDDSNPFKIEIEGERERTEREQRENRENRERTERGHMC
jgi:hypothetical protein